MRWLRRTSFLLSAWLVASCAAFSSPSTLAADEGERRQAQLDVRVGELISQLGSSEYAVRDKAKSELSRLGLAAFDALHEAQSHRDVEIGMQAQYLVRSAQVAWQRDEDPPEVKAILKEYGQQAPEERAVRIGRLARLEDRQGWEALCRLARFETEETLSKQAALAIMQLDPPAAQEISQAATALQLGVGQSRRRAAQWLRSYARWLGEPETIVSEWSRLVNEEFELLASEQRQTSLEVVTSLGRWHAETLLRLGHEPETKAMVKRLGSLADGSQESLLEHIDWLGHREMWSYILDASQEFGPLFVKEQGTETAMLLYRLAEAQRRLELPQAAETAAKALALPGDFTEAHIQAAFKLAERGLFDWSETEYRAVFKIEPELNSRENLRARFLLSEMLHDQQRQRDAAEVLQPIVTALQEPPAPGARENLVEQAVGMLGREPGGIKSRMHYFFAVDALAKGETEAGVKYLNDGVKADPQDADVLIALFRQAGLSAEQKANTRRLIREATDAFLLQASEATRNMAQLQMQLPNTDLEFLRRQLAMAHNQFAWLVANTEGDFEAAVAASHESLKLRPEEPAYLDTLGRCYFAHGDLASAIKYQREAIRKEPHSGQMRRQLAMFMREAEKTKPGNR